MESSDSPERRTDQLDWAQFEQEAQQMIRSYKIEGGFQKNEILHKTVTKIRHPEGRPDLEYRYEFRENDKGFAIRVIDTKKSKLDENGVAEKAFRDIDTTEFTGSPLASTYEYVLRFTWSRRSLDGGPTMELLLNPSASAALLKKRSEEKRRNELSAGELKEEVHSGKVDWLRPADNLAWAFIRLEEGTLLPAWHPSNNVSFAENARKLLYRTIIQ